MNYQSGRPNHLPNCLAPYLAHGNQTTDVSYHYYQHHHYYLIMMWQTWIC